MLELPNMRDVRSEQLDRSDWAAATGPEWQSAASILQHLERNSHSVEAARAFPWERVLAPGASILDLACGTGWLTGILSARPEVERVIAWDASPTLLREMLPASIELTDGDIRKIETVCGLFIPLLLDDNAVDCAVLCSAFHHAERPDELLEELIRVVRPGGAIVLVNEIPHPRRAMLRWVATTALAASVNSLWARAHLAKPGHVGADHIVYDDTLGDRALTMAQWRRLFGRHPIDVEVIDSGLVPYRPAFRPPGRGQRNLTHFILRPS